MSMQGRSHDRQRWRAGAHQGGKRHRVLGTEGGPGLLTQRELCMRDRPSARPQQPQRLRWKLPDSNEALATVILIHGDKLKRERPLRGRIVRKQSGEHELVVTIVLHPDDYTFVVVR